MKAILLNLALAISVSLSCQAQGTSGLIGHWKMSGNASDASGNGHNGSVRSVTPAPGRDGVPGTALYFSGNTSYLSIPYKSDLNMTQVSICATIKVTKFYTGACQANYLFARGRQGGSASYSLLLFDNAYNDCNTVDTTKEVFAAEAGQNNGTNTAWMTTRNIQSSQWYRVVATFDGSVYKMYVNDTLVATNPVASPVLMGNSTDGILIGCLDSVGGYPYPFTGFIDDIRLYNRPLADSEVVQYGASTLSVPDARTASQISVYPNPATNVLTVSGEVSNARYQIYDVVGRMISNGVFSGANNEISVADLLPAVYHIRIQRGEHSEALKFVKE